jgi:energy-converting hydrogenase Eha subunit B
MRWMSGERPGIEAAIDTTSTNKCYLLLLQGGGEGGLVLALVEMCGQICSKCRYSGPVGAAICACVHTCRYFILKSVHV